MCILGRVEEAEGREWAAGDRPRAASSVTFGRLWIRIYRDLWTGLNELAKAWKYHEFLEVEDGVNCAGTEAAITGDGTQVPGWPTGPLPPVDLTEHMLRKRERPTHMEHYMHVQCNFCGKICLTLGPHFPRQTRDYTTDWDLNIGRGPHGVGHAQCTVNVMLHTEHCSKQAVSP